MILQTQQRFKSEKHNVFTEHINKIALCSNNDKINVWNEKCIWNGKISNKWKRTDQM